MKHNKLLTLSLLVSFLILTASFSSAANVITYADVTSQPYPVNQTFTIPVLITNDVAVSAFDLVGRTISGGDVSFLVTGVTFDTRMANGNVLNERYGIQDLGSGKFRLGAIKTDPIAGLDLAASAGQVALLTCKFTSNCKLGTATIEPTTGIWNGHDVVTEMIASTGEVIDPLEIVNGGVTVENNTPFFTDCPTVPYEVFWKDGFDPYQVVYIMHADDIDLPCGCDVLNYSKIDGPGNMSGNQYSWNPGPTEIGCHTVTVKVEDFYGAADTCVFEIWVLNVKPQITCPDDIEALMGETITATVTAVDPDAGPLGMTFSLGAGTTATGATIGLTSGIFEWVIPDDPDFVGEYTVEAIVTDGAPLSECNTVNADTCYFNITVKPSYRVIIEYKDSDAKGDGVTQGHYHDLNISLVEDYCGGEEYTVMEMGGYDFLISYAHSLGALTFMSAEPGDLLVQGEWEYFTYRFGPFGNCGSACPSGLVRITAMAETNDGPHTAVDFDNSEGDNVLAVMKFYVSNDRTYNCYFAPVEFYWIDCGDNTISSKEGDTLFLERSIVDFECDPLELPEGYDLLPGYWGISDACLEEQLKTFPYRGIDFKNGGFKIICSDSIDAMGDININGIAYEIADAVMYTRYFIEGLSAFGDHIEASIAASDVNADGITLSVSDLVYLVRVVTGDALPYNKLTPNAQSINVATQLMGGNMSITYDASTDVGAMLMIFGVNGTIGEPVKGDGAANMDLDYKASGNELRVLIYNIGKNAILSGRHDLVNIPVEGSLELKSVEVADYFGNPMDASTRVLPSQYELAQNYPNPFNPTTTIELALPVASDYSLAIYNVAGQLIRTYNGTSEAGVVPIVWDGKDASGNAVASGMYFYKGTAQGYSATKKMILMK